MVQHLLPIQVSSIPFLRSTFKDISWHIVLLGTAFMDGLSVTGWVGTSGRGYVAGDAIGIPTAFASYITVGWENTVAQYWATANTAGGYSSPAMKPGTYTMNCEHSRDCYHRPFR